jgi:hypothetical protein
MMKSKMLFATLVIFALIGLISAQNTGAKSARDVICTILNNVAWLMQVVAAGVGIVVIIIQGIKWAGSAEDPGARKQAKQGIIHAVIGLIIVVVAVNIVMLVMANDCPGWFAL